MDPQQQQEMSNTLENMLGCSSRSVLVEKKAKAGLEHAVECPRCESTNTKFCYYNNYSLSQPRYFCKSCRRYWTKGGTLRNVPVGGGCRKNKRSSSKRSQPQDHLFLTSSNPYDSNDLTLAFATLQKQQSGSGSGSGGLGFDHHHDHQFSNNSTQGASFLDALRCGYHNQNSPNLYYGYGGNGEVENDHVNVSGQTLVLPYAAHQTNATTTAVTVTTMKQEIMCNGISTDQAADHNKMLWGLPWHINDQANNININTNLGDLDSGRETWTGFAPSWHGLLNSPLM